MRSQADIFRCHAKMYIVADCYGISDLMDLALNKLARDSSRSASPTRRLRTFSTCCDTVTMQQLPKS